jgi:glycosyltransferase involved in cell wall biosynthesis
MTQPKLDLIITLPFYNEEKSLPLLLESLLKSSKGILNYGLVLINHLSTDNSLQIIESYRSKFCQVHVVDEDYPIHCGGVPRNRGIKYSISLAESLDYDVPIATIDCDTEVSPEFGQEIIDHITSYDIIVFPERYKQNCLLEWVGLQANQDTAAQALIGVNWLRYQVLWSLIFSGITETRGPGGYAMLPSTFKRLGHKQPVDANNLPVTGENNRLGILANNFGLKVYASPYLTLVDPRREISSLGSNATKGYGLNKDRAEIFKLARSSGSYPSLSTQEWEEYLKKGIWRTVRMVLIRAICYRHLEALRDWMIYGIWQKIIDLTDSYIKDNPPTTEELEVVGSAYYTTMFDHITQSLNQEEQSSFIQFIKSSLPVSSDLINWSKNNSLILPPQNGLINDLTQKYEHCYSGN